MPGIGYKGVTTTERQKGEEGAHLGGKGDGLTAWKIRPLVLL